MSGEPTVVDEMDRIGVHLTGEQFGMPGTPESLRGLLGGLSAASVVQSAAKVVHHLEQPGAYLNPEGQLALVEVFPPAMHETLEEMLALGGSDGGVDVLFHRQQMLALQKAALAAGTPGPPESLDGAAMWAFVKAAAQVNGIIDRFTGGWTENAAGASNRDLALWKLRQIAMHRNVFFKAEAGRAYRLWIDSRVVWPDHVEHPEEYTQRRFGCSLQTVLAVASTPMFQAMYASQDQDPGGAVLDPGVFFEPTAIDTDTATGILDAITYRPRGPAALDDEATYCGWADVAARPYMPAGPNLLTVASPAMAFVRATTGVFWMLHAEVSGTGRIHDLTGHFGRMFEDYVLRLAEEVASDRLLVFGDVVYGREERRSSDVLICQAGPERRARVFVEAGAVRPTRPVFEYGDTAEFDTYVDRLAEKLDQLDRSITDHIQGRFDIAGDPLVGELAYVPVLVVDGPFTWSPELRDLLDSRSDVAGLFRQQMATSPVVCSIGEYESLIHHVDDGGDLVGTLLDYIADERHIPLEMHLHDRAGTLEVPDLVGKGFLEMADAWLNELQLHDG